MVDLVCLTACWSVWYCLDVRSAAVCRVLCAVCVVQMTATLCLLLVAVCLMMREAYHWS
jgi:hypothetical protein